MDIARLCKPSLAVVSVTLAAANLSAVEFSPTNSASAFADLTIEQLMNESVTSVSKKETRLNDSPAAIAVVTSEDIRRHGVTTFADALRLVPGMDVAQVNSHEWAISARGFNNQFANKLLVLVDGRSVYGTGFGGVVWGVQDTVMEDLDRIEVIRGPGGTLWGANAVNGVINIITKSAKDTQGVLVTATGGTVDQPGTAVRYGGKLGTNLFYRAYIKQFNRDGSVLQNGSDSPDDGQELQAGARVDWEPTENNRLTLQGDFYRDRFRENQDMPNIFGPVYTETFVTANHSYGGNVLGRWTHEFSEDSSLTLQSYYDHSHEEQAGVFESVDTVDFDAQHRFALGSRNDVMWGAGYRHVADEFGHSAFVSWNPSRHSEQLFSAFVQDEVAVAPDRFSFTIGSKFEHNDYTGFEIQPSVRLLWKATEKQTVWAAVSRAVRTPSRSDLHSTANLAVIPPFPPFMPETLISSSGNPNLRSEELIAYELGYRAEITKRFSLDIAGFFNQYDHIIMPSALTTNFVFVPPSGPGYVQIDSRFANGGRGETYGAEVAARWNVTDQWHLMASYSWLGTHLNSSPFLGGSPHHQAQLSSSLNLPWNLELNGAVFYVEQIRAPYGIGSTTIASYIRTDVGLIWRATKNLEFGVWGQNLMDDRHSEYASYKTSVITEVPRSFFGKVTLRF